jgi:predicted TIM-barrel enzyme
VLANTSGVDGFFGASSLERLPTETAMTAAIAEFKAVPA